MKNDIVCVPYHDWRKIEREGNRTRDAHFIEHFSKRDREATVLVVNRPTSYVEIFYQRYSKRIKGEIVLQKGAGTLYKVGGNIFVMDYITKDIFKPIVKKRLWLLSSFDYPDFYNFYLSCVSHLGLQSPILVSNNVFSVNFVGKVNTACTIFDAFDNFLKFPVNIPIVKELEKAYEKFSSVASIWLTNSDENINFFKAKFSVSEIFLVKNGVDVEKFNKKRPLPEDLKEIPRPIVGFGGKITHLFDYSIINRIANDHPEKSFVVLGQILDKEAFSKLDKKKNIYYLGDKSYDIYPNYVSNFDLGIVPYVNKEKSHGGDSIKIYEYLAAGLKVVSTFHNEDLNFKGVVYVCSNEEDFSKYIDEALENETATPSLEPYTWRSKVEGIISLATKWIAR